MKQADIPVFPSRSDVVTLAAQSFRKESGESIMGILDLYGVNPTEPHREAIQVALIFYAEGDVEKLLSLVEKAKVNYRDCLYAEAFASNPAARELESQGWEFFPAAPLLPHYSPVTKEVAAQLLQVHWKLIDQWVKEGRLRPLIKARGAYRSAIEELERFQRQNEPEVNIAEIWQAQQVK